MATRAIDTEPDALRLFHEAVRAATDGLSAPLSDADATVQSMPDASPAKWHLAHTTWFFEAVVLEPYLPGYSPFDPRFGYLFNSYYEALGPRHDRSRRGMLTRPTLDEVRAYRRHVDTGMARLFDTGLCAQAAGLVELGCHHEQQHQELLLTDILHLFAANPLEPAYLSGPPVAPRPSTGLPGFTGFRGGLAEFGHSGDGFAFDCEGPRHTRWLDPFRIADAPVTNGEWAGFIADGGYHRPELWLSDGWAARCLEGWEAPLYWCAQDGGWTVMTLRGRTVVDLAAPVSHVSLYEADAFARWQNKRLPTEFEWEHAAANCQVSGNLAGSGLLQPMPGSGTGPMRQAFGDVWEWTESAFARYPGFRPAEGAVGEYNGKFMSGQCVLRGGSCVTPEGHARPTYRNFFPPSARWQFSGLRLAEDAE